jgi:threonine/homoserine/homoserine lactone efflux protein
MEPLTFAAASVAILLTPGPTNTLLATSGASIGIRRSLYLLGAEIAGYMLSITALRGIFGPIIGTHPAIELALRLGVTLYLVYLAVKLWRHGNAELQAANPVTFGRVFFTTFLNPKGLIFAFTLLPQGGPFASLMPWMAALALVIPVMGSFWIALGASLRSGFKGLVSSTMGYRASALALLLLAGFVSSQALG